MTPRKAAAKVKKAEKAGGGASDDRAVALLQEYLRINTTNPPGDEGPAAEFLEAILAGSGVKAKILTSPDGRPNLVARLKGKKGSALALMHHMDVVPCDETKWSVDPFGGEVKDGHIWGRGAIDMKGQGLMQVLAFCELAEAVESGERELDRDALLVAVSDEEEAGADGAGWLVSTHPAEVECAELLTEGGAGLRDALPGVDAFACAMTEKSFLWLRLLADGEPGHGSVPPDDQAIVKILDLMAELRKISRRLHMSPPVARLFSSLADAGDAKLKAAIRAATSPAGPAVLPLIAKQLGSAQQALLRDTISITQVQAGYKSNVIPGSASATIDCRLLPDTDPDAYLKKLRAIAASHDVRIEEIDIGTSGGISEPGELYRALEAACGREAPTARFVQSVSPGFTDSRFWRNAGTSCLGLLPSLLTSELLATIHGDDERIPVDEYLRGCRITAEVLRSVCSASSTK